jgi:hypothetical protein
MTAGSFHRANLLLIDPLFQRDLPHGENLRCFARRKEFGCQNNDALEVSHCFET